MFTGMNRPKPRPAEIAAQEEQTAKKQQAAKGLFAGLAPKAGADGAKQNVLAVPTLEDTPQKKFAFKGNMVIKKSGQPLASATKPPQQQQQQQQPQQRQGNNGTVDLFGAMVSKPQQQQQQQQQQNSALDIFDFSASSTPSKSSQQPSQTSMFDFASPSKSDTTLSSNTPSNSGAFDLLSSFGGSSGPASTTSNTVLPTQSNPPSNDAFDLFGFTSNATTTATTPSNNGNNTMNSDIFNNSKTDNTFINAVQTTLQNDTLFQNYKSEKIDKIIVKTNNDSNFELSVQNLPTCIIVNLKNLNQSNRYDNQPIKVQLQSQINFNQTKSLIFDQKGSQTAKLSQNGFSLQSTSQGLSSVQLLLVPDSASIPTQTVLQFAIGTTVITANNFNFPPTSYIKPLTIQTKQYAECWKAFGTAGEYKLTINTNPTGAITTPDAVPPLLRRANIHPVQTIKQETIAAALLLGHNQDELFDYGVLLHVKVLGEGQLSLHCRSKWSPQAAQAFVEAFVQVVQGKL